MQAPFDYSHWELLAQTPCKNSLHEVAQVLLQLDLKYNAEITQSGFSTACNPFAPNCDCVIFLCWGGINLVNMAIFHLLNLPILNSLSSLIFAGCFTSCALSCLLCSTYKNILPFNPKGLGLGLLYQQWLIADKYLIIGLLTTSKSSRMKDIM